MYGHGAISESSRSGRAASSAFAAGFGPTSVTQRGNRRQVEDAPWRKTFFGSARVVYYHYANTTTSDNWTDQEKIGQKLSRVRM